MDSNERAWHHTLLLHQHCALETIACGALVEGVALVRQESPFPVVPGLWSGHHCGLVAATLQARTSPARKVANTQKLAVCSATDIFGC